MRPLNLEQTHHEYLHSKLRERFLDADDKTPFDTLEGMTDRHEMIGSVVRSREDDLSPVTSLKSRIADMQARLDRLNLRADGKNKLSHQPWGGRESYE